MRLIILRLTSLIFTIIFSLQLLAAQDFYDRDSLWQVFKKSIPDTSRVLLYIQLGQQYENNNPDSAILLYESALHLSEDLNYIPGIIKYYTNVTYVYNLLGRYDTSLVLNLKSVEIARGFGNQERLGACLANVGTSYMTLKNYEKAVGFFLQALEIYERLKIEDRLGILYSNLTIVYREIGQVDKAFAHGEKALLLARKMKNPFAITTSLINLSLVYNATGNLTKSISMLEEARALGRQTHNDYSTLITSLNLFEAYLIKADYGKMKKYSEEALALALKLNDRESIAIALRGLAIYQLSQGQVKEAEGYALRSLKEARANQFSEHMGKAYSVLADVAIVRGEFGKNTTYSFKSDSIRKVLVNESIHKNIQELEIKYQTEKKELQIKQLEADKKLQQLSIRQKNTLNYILIGSAITLLIISLLSYRTYQQKQNLQQQRISELETEKQLTATEAVLLGEEQERTRLAQDLHDGLGGMLSGIKYSFNTMKQNLIMTPDNQQAFERSMDMLDSSIKEMRRVAHNMMPEALVKFGLDTALKDFCTDINQSGALHVNYQSIGLANANLSQTTAITIYRVVQELINNTMKHAAAKTAIVQITKSDNQVAVTVEDDGKGFDTMILKKSKGIGWVNIQHRIDFLKGKLDVNSSPGKGTSVHIEFDA